MSLLKELGQNNLDRVAINIWLLTVPVPLCYQPWLHRRDLRRIDAWSSLLDAECPKRLSIRL